jgi:membrane protein
VAGAFSIGIILGLAAAWSDRVRGRSRPPGAASTPADVPAGGWREVLVRAVKAFGQDRIPSAAAAVTFYVLLALFPALSAFVSLYGLLADPKDVRDLVLHLEGMMPGGAVKVLTDELKRLTGGDHGALGLAFFVSLAVSLWSANGGAKAMIEALNVAYETKERRGFVSLTATSLAFTVGGVAVAVAAIAVMAAAPAALAMLGAPKLAGLAILRWPLMLIIATLVFSVLYRFAPCRPQPRWRWITPGGAIAAAAWVAMSGLFSWYVQNFGHYDKTYGSLGAMVGFLTWVWLSLMVVLLGAELNREVEKAAEARAGARAQ